MITVGLVFSAIRCAPEYSFTDDSADGGTGSSAPGHCFNGHRDTDLNESRVDCGGECPPCAEDCFEGTGECDRDPVKLCETNVLTSAENCGSCGSACELPHAIASCSGGKCQAAFCERPFDNCDDTAENGCETNISTSATNCGACNERCSNIHGTAACENGSCLIECDESWDDCNRRVTDGCETPTLEDARNCGQCGTECKPAPGETPFCKDGACGSTLCDVGRGDCDGEGTCDDELDTDPNNCGYCGHHCIVSNGVGECVDGECRIEKCDPDFANCDADDADGGYATGCEANTRSSIQNCGACGKACSTENGMAGCFAGECRISACTPPFADCDGDGETCETDTRSDSSNCGGCARLGGVNCDATFGTNNANGRCEDGRCTFDGCRPGFQDCNNDEIACEVDVRNDSENCGGCEVLCAVTEGTVTNTCSDAACKPVCTESFRNCNADGADGCESNVLTDAANCGMCGAACDQTGTTKNTCDEGKCTPTCTNQAGDCDGIGSNGCETDVTTNPLHCGGCGGECLVPRGTISSSCLESQCVPVCEPGRGDCDGKGENGCEAFVLDDQANCGGCGRACRSGEGTNATANVCEDVECKPTCQTGWGACENPELGCTIPLDTPEHCGSCTNRCSGATPRCVEGGCQARIAILQQAQNGAQSPRLNFDLELQSGQNRLLLIAVTGRSMKGTGSFEQGRPETVRYGGTDMLLFAELNGGDGPSNSAGQNHLFLYYLLEGAAMKALGTGQKGVEIVATSPQGAQSLAANAVLFSGVNQAAPFGAAQPKNVAVNCMDGTPEDTMTVGEGSVIYSLVAAQHTGTEVGSTMPMTRTLDFKLPMTPNPTFFDVAVQGGHIGVSSVLSKGMQMFRWTYGSCSNWTMLSVVIQPARR